jgi:hypothetical protein
VYTLSSSSSFGHELSDGTTLVYAQGSQDTLLSMSNGNESLHAALSDQITVANADHFAAAEGAAAASEAAAGAGTMAGVSTAALVVGGVVVVGAAVAIDNNNDSDSSSSSDTKTASFVDSAVGGIDY